MSTDIGLVVLGAGTVGRALLGQLAEHRAAVEERLGLRLHVLRVATSRLWTTPAGESLTDEALAALAGEGLAAVDHAAYAFGDLIRELHAPHLAGRRRPAALVVVDVTASDATGGILAHCLAIGHHVVLANKKPLSGDDQLFTALTTRAPQRGRTRYEATAGAGLPVISTLQDMVATGDRVLAIDAALSGTLGYICTALEDGVPFSEAVRAAHRAGYTEPDPRDDLSGRDVARKAVILARTCGFSASLDTVPPSGLGDLGRPEATPAEFLAALDDQDAAIAARVAEARGVDRVLRYVARVTPEGAATGLQAVPRDHPLAALRGTANLVAIISQRYQAAPLVVSGPGAGAAVTAAGVFADVLRVTGAG